jgi:hypothetical protein
MAPPADDPRYESVVPTVATRRHIWPRLRRDALVVGHGSMAARAFAVAGYAFTLAVLVAMATSGLFHWPDRDAFLWHDVGADILAGRSPYTLAGPGGFFYAPPWAIGLALVAWVPVQAIAAGILALEVLALRYVAGSWTRAGWLCWLPIVPLELFGSQWNLVMAAAIAAAARGDPRGAVAMAFAKLSPALAIDVRQRRQALLLAAAIGAVTLPWLWLWPEWARQLASSYGANIAPGAELTIPLLPRLVAAGALALVGTRRPWARAAAAIVATPALYWASGVLLFALLPRRAQIITT